MTNELSTIVPTTRYELHTKDHGCEATMRLMYWLDDNQHKTHVVIETGLNEAFAVVEGRKIHSAEYPSLMKKLEEGLRDETPWAIEVIIAWCNLRQWYTAEEQRSLEASSHEVGRYTSAALAP